MKTIGTFLIILGIAAIILGFMNSVPAIAEWIYTWGEGIAWAIKIGFVVIGAALYFIANKRNVAITRS